MKVFTFVNVEGERECRGRVKGWTRPWIRDADTKLTALCSPPPQILRHGSESALHLSWRHFVTPLRATAPLCTVFTSCSVLEINGEYNCERELCFLLGCAAVWSGKKLLTFRRTLKIAAMHFSKMLVITKLCGVVIGKNNHNPPPVQKKKCFCS
jgi:hypothetical protein